MSIRATAWIIILSLAWGVQALMAAVWAGSFFPPHSTLTGAIYAEFAATLRPEHETLYYRLFAAAVVGAFAFLMSRPTASRRVPESALKIQALIEAGYTAFLAWPAFQILLHPSADGMPRAVMAAGLAGAAALKAFHRLLPGLARQWAVYAERLSQSPLLRLMWTAAGTVFIALIIYIPDVEGLAARMFVGEQFHHNDSFIMGPVLAASQGLVPDVDVISQYGIGFPYVVAGVARMVGGLDYVSVIKAMVLLTALYYILWFWLLRAWFKSVTLALTVLLLAIKWQMFHPGVFPVTFTYGSTTPVRYWADVLFFFCVWRHVSGRQPVFAVAAAAVSGFQVFYLLSEGVYLCLAWATYVLLDALWVYKQGRGYGVRQWAVAAGLLCLPLAVTAVCLTLTMGSSWLLPEFRKNILEFSAYFLNSFGVEPMTRNLLDKQFGAALMGFVIPLVYMLSLCGSILWAIFGKETPRLRLMAVLAVYGLGSYHYFVARSTLTSYYVEALPFVWILGLAAAQAMEPWPPGRRRMVVQGALAACVIALGTTRLFAVYPNSINAGRNPYTNPRLSLPAADGGSYYNHLFRGLPEPVKVDVNSAGERSETFVTEKNFADDKALKAYVRRESDFSRDAALIRRLTPEGARVPLISSFEIPMLMQAGRKPYFYYFPLVISHPMTSRAFVQTSIYTVPQLRKILEKLEGDRPAYIFVERLLLSRPVPDYFVQYYGATMYLTEYVLAHYDPAAQGQYLVALRRKKND